MDKAQTVTIQAAEKDKPTGYPTMQCTESRGGKGQYEAMWRLLTSVKTERTDATLSCSE